MSSNAGFSAGWWTAAERRASPNFDPRPDALATDLVVLHHISLPAGQFTGNAVADFFENRLDVVQHPQLVELTEIHVSAHFFVRRDGATLQFVSCNDRAWHAGVSKWRGRAGCNDFSIGIEMEGDDKAAFSQQQYTALNELLAALKFEYPIKAVTTHSEIAPGRKIDPGPTFDWSRLEHHWNV
ncbi:MAG: 1,6-anhydro-N-acetylmuramyl-L-alanine amidase AmpD [Rhizobacter sp.]|nr:1,6-anhydro-N-acetylmuramyl-L-alanine amidase AmpD [Burkholderiales bacterium]